MEFMRLSSLEPSDAPKSTMKRRNSADMVSLSSGRMSRHSKDAENGELTALPLEVKCFKQITLSEGPKWSLLPMTLLDK